jgi:hypothetical protein
MADEIRNGDSPPLAGQQQHLEQRSERARSAGCHRRVDGFACPPEPADFVGGQHAIARLRPRGPVHTRTRIALDAALTLEPAEHAREGGKERAPTAIGYIAIARRDAGYSDPPRLVDHATNLGVRSSNLFGRANKIRNLG